MCTKNVSYVSYLVCYVQIEQVLSVEEFQNIYPRFRHMVRKITSRGLIKQPNKRPNHTIFKRMSKLLNLDTFDEEEIWFNIRGLVRSKTLNRPHKV